MRFYFLLFSILLGAVCLAREIEKEEPEAADRVPSAVEQVTPAPADAPADVVPTPIEPEPDPRRPYPYLENDRG